MKVFIGKYPKYLCSEKIVQKILFWKPINDKLIERIASILDRTWLDSFINWINSKRKQTIYVKTDPDDTFNMDSTLALIITPMLKQIKQCKWGYVLVDMEDIPAELQVMEVTDEQRWEYVLDQMIWSFERSQPDSDQVEEYFIFNEEGLVKFNHEGLKVYDERMQNGFRLFGKYYKNLWE